MEIKKLNKLFPTFMCRKRLFSKQCFVLTRRGFMLIIIIWFKIQIKNKIRIWTLRRNKRMQSYLISKDLDNLLFLDVINEDFQEQSKLISILISSLIQQSPLLSIYKEKKKLLLDTLNSQRVNEKNLFRENLVSFSNFWNLKPWLILIFYFKKWLKVQWWQNWHRFLISHWLC